VTPEAWIAALAEAAAEARERAGHAVLRFRIGAQTVRIRVAPESASSLLRPIAGLTDSDGDGRTIDLWDVAACDVPPPSLPEEGREAGPMGAISWLSSPTTAGAFQQPGRMLIAWDAESETVTGCIGEPASLPSWQLAEPLRAPLNWALKGRGRALAHAAALGLAGGGPGLLIGGPGGSGKSTTALSWLLAGGDFAGDNYVLIEMDGPGGPTAAPIYTTAKADDGAISMLPALAPVAQEGDETLRGKRLLDVRDLRPDQPAEPIRITAIVISRVTDGREPVVRPVSGASALKYLAPSSLLQLPGESDAFSVLADLVRGLPCFEIELIAAPEANVDALERVIQA
jgi:hypothetical protein